MTVTGQIPMAVYPYQAILHLTPLAGVPLLTEAGTRNAFHGPSTAQWGSSVGNRVRRWEIASGSPPMVS
jgi:hypothetical protein